MTWRFCESEVEDAALAWLSELGWQVRHGPEIAPGEIFAERQDYGEVVLLERFRNAFQRLNPDLPEGTLADVERRVLRPEAPLLSANNRQFHRWLVDGVTAEFRASDGEVRGRPVQLVDFEEPENNDWLAVNQFTVVENGHNRRPDIVLFVNGLPLGVIELKNPTEEEADVWSAFGQLQTYKSEIPALFVYNEALVVSDGLEARMGTLTSGKEWFLPWRTIEGREVEPTSRPQLEVLLRGVFEHRRFLDLLRYFIVFEDERTGGLAKKMARYHQFHAVQVAVEATVAAARPGGDRRCGVVWHTQGSGKSLTMAFYAGRIVQHPALGNPTVVVITDRNDLDDQLFDTFCRCQELLRQTPKQAESREHLRQLLQVASGGVVFTTIQKFLPESGRMPRLSERHNIVVIADEAHRSQYDFIDGFARNLRDALPNASFIGFTATPIEFSDRNTRAVFGDYISVYDIQRAVEDKATVPIFYESRLARLDLPEDEKPRVDAEFEEVTEAEEVEHKERLKSKWARLEKVVGTKKRLEQVAKDLVEHWEQRREVLEGKAMVVCMSRRICVDLYEEIVRLRPEWGGDDETGRVMVVMTGSASDPVGWQRHIRNKEKRRELADRFRDPKDRFQIVIVRDMWLTGFDAPCLHTMYLDKPMRGHGLMQAIARVNRVFRDKPGGLVVDYIGIADSLKQALAIYTESGGKGTPALDQEEAVAKMLEKHEVCCAMFYGFDWSDWASGKPGAQLALLPKAQQHILAQENGRERFAQAVKELSVAFALSVPHPEALRIRDDVGFFQAVRAAIGRKSPERKLAEEELDQAIKQIVSRAISADRPIDIFAEAGLKKPDISILSDEFLAEVRGMPHKNLAVEVLRKLLNEEIRCRARTFLVQSQLFSEKLQRAIAEYHNRTIQTIDVIERLIALAREMREAAERGARLGLTDEELAFYDALETNDSAVAVLGDETLRTIAREVADTIRKNVTIDWTMKEGVRARLRVLVKRVLRRHGYPPDKQEQATKTVLEQAELIAQRLAA